MSYCIDTSSLIAAWHELYPPANFPSFWNHLDSLIRSGRLYSPFEVRREITNKSEALSSWLDDRKGMFVQLDANIQAEVKEVLARFQSFARGHGGKEFADPFVVALGKCNGYIVITEEKGGSDTKPKIPFVCNHYGIGCINILGLIQAEKWVI